MADIQDDICAYGRNTLHYPAYRLVMSTMYSAAGLVTTRLNLLILVSIWKTPSLHKPSYILIGSLALSDLLVGAIGDPLMVIDNIAALRGWSLKIFCLVEKCAKGVVCALATVSLLTLTAKSVDRLLAVKLKNRYQSVVTKKRVVYVLLTCWITSSVLSATLFGFPRLNSPNWIALLLFVGIGALFIVLILTVCYAMAFSSLRKISSCSVSPSFPSGEAVASLSSNIDVAKYGKPLITMLVVFIFTMLFYVPFISILLACVITADHRSLQTSIKTNIGIGVGELIVLLNSAMNPLLYLWRIRDVREAVKTTVEKTFKVS